MAELVMLQQAGYQAPATSPPQGRKQGRAALNTIIEEDENAMSPIRSPMKRRLANRVSRDRDRLQAWLSPVNDAFPTPRGFHFMVAPNLPSSPSAASFDDDSVSPTLSSNRTNSWNRQSVMTDVTDFDDLYDISDEDDEPQIESMRRQAPVMTSSKATPEQTRRALPPLVIPASRGIVTSESPAAYLKKSLTSPVPPTPPSAVAMSPAMISFIQSQQAQDVPTISAPPSLDGSLSSEQLAVISAPPTPIIGGQDSEDTGDWSGIHLQPGALATLHALSGAGSDIEEYQPPADQVIEVPQEPMAETRQQPPRLITNLPRASIMLSPAQQRSLAGLTRLEIPSPGGFFSGLSPRTRTTWHFGASPVDDMPPPTSTTAEQFYRTPWNMDPAPPMPRPAQVQRPLHMASGNFSSLPVEQVVEAPETTQDDLPTALRVEETPVPNTAKRIPAPPSTTSDEEDESSSPRSPKEMIKEIVADVNPDFARRQQEAALSHLDRTEMWLMAQRAYLRGPGEFEENEDGQVEEGPSSKAKAKGKESELQLEAQAPPEVPPKDNEPERPEVGALTKKKTVRFSEQVMPEQVPRSLPSKLIRQESAYYRAFQDLTVRTLPHDVFVHRMPRFEALQAQRISLREAHRNQLLGKYQLSVLPQSAKKRMSANVVRGDDVLLDDPEKLKAEKEAEALSQMNMSTWHVAATRLLNGGRLIAAPVHKRLARMSTHGGTSNGRRERTRILDLGGQSTGDWAWHAALQYPNAKIYTVTTKAIRQLSNSNIRGPPNHRQVAVERLARLPFPDDHFDLVSARELHSILKFVGEHGEDEWESCLRECFRVLKTGGYLEFQVLDSDIVNAGPLGLAKSVEFGFTLKTLGYDPNPTRMFLNRLSRAGFQDVRRAWMALPMGPKPSPRPGATATAARQSMLNPVAPGGKTLELEAMVTGSAEHVAGVTGLAAGWSWERWLLRCEMEKAAGELRLADTVTAGDAMREAGKGVDNVHAVVDEGRACKAAFRMLKGYARKPKPDTGTLTFVLDFDSMI